MILSGAGRQRGSRYICGTDADHAAFPECGEVSHPGKTAQASAEAALFLPAWQADAAGGGPHPLGERNSIF